MQQLWTSCSHTRASVTKQYDLVPVKNRHVMEDMWSIVRNTGLTAYGDVD